VILTEDAPFGSPAGNKCDPHIAAMRSTEEQALTAPEGIALRYGLLYSGDAQQMRPLLAKRGVPVAAGGPLGWIHLQDAVAATARPRVLPGWLFRLAAPYVAAFVVDTAMRVANTKAKKELGWRPTFPTYRDGIDALARADAVARR
jgi:hypothetical protein